MIVKEQYLKTSGNLESTIVSKMSNLKLQIGGREMKASKKGLHRKPFVSLSVCLKTYFQYLDRRDFRS